MNKEKATLTLTRMLCNLGYVNLVIDPAVKSYFLNNAKSVVFSSGKGVTSVTPLSRLYLPRFAEMPIPRNAAPSEVKGIFPEANYLFVEKGKKSEYEENRLDKVLVTPVALIGEMEEKVLRENFYKDVPEEIIESFRALDIPHFVKHHKFYSSWVINGPWPHNLGDYRPFRQGEKVEIGDIIQGAESKLYYLVDGIKNDGVIEGDKFKDVMLKVPCNKRGTCNLGYIIPIKKRFQISDDEFFTFVFSLPYEEQNIEANKNILGHYSKDGDYIPAMINEYCHGKYFQEYFDVLNQESQHAVVTALENIIGENLIHNSFLWSKGFKNMGLDHLTLYKNDAENFIEYFSNRSIEEKEVILKDIMDCDSINGDVVNWMNENEGNLIKKVGFYG